MIYNTGGIDTLVIMFHKAIVVSPRITLDIVSSINRSTNTSIGLIITGIRSIPMNVGKMVSSYGIIKSITFTKSLITPPGHIIDASNCHTNVSVEALNVSSNLSSLGVESYAL